MSSNLEQQIKISKLEHPYKRGEVEFENGITYSFYSVVEKKRFESRWILKLTLESYSDGIEKDFEIKINVQSLDQIGRILKAYEDFMREIKPI